MRYDSIWMNVMEDAPGVWFSAVREYPGAEWAIGVVAHAGDEPEWSAAGERAAIEADWDFYHNDPDPVEEIDEFIVGHIDPDSLSEEDLLLAA